MFPRECFQMFPNVSKCFLLDWRGIDVVFSSPRDPLALSHLSDQKTLSSAHPSLASSNLSLLEQWRLGILRKQRSKDQYIATLCQFMSSNSSTFFVAKECAGDKHGPSIPMLPWNPVLPDQGLNHRYESGGLPLPEATSQVV